MELVKENYILTKSFPSSEKYSLCSQMNRAIISIPSNIAEGTSKNSDKHFKKYIEDSLGSAFEWETQLIIAYDQGYLTKEKFEKLEDKIKQVQKMISKFKSSLDF